MPNSWPILHGIGGCKLARSDRLRYKPALREEISMARSLRLLLSAVLFSAIFASAACEDDPHDLDYLDAGDHGDHGDHDDDAG
jgi:hypothetical protein